jgi:hypothetical protein
VEVLEEILACNFSFHDCFYNELKMYVLWNISV